MTTPKLTIKQLFDRESCTYTYLLIDADKQGSASTWASLRDDAGFKIISLARENMARDAIKLAADHTHTIIDGPPHAEAIARSCIIASDVVVHQA